MLFLINLCRTLLLVAGVYGGKQKRILEPSEDATEDEHPWMAALTDPRGGFCGGVIINRCHILAAAHCFTLGKPIKKVILGTHKSSLRYLNRGIIYQRGRERNSFTYKIHESAKEKNDWIPDIVLIRLSNPLTYVKGRIEPICLSDEQPVKGWNVTAYGWGNHLITKKGKIQNILKKRKDKIGRCSKLSCVIQPEITGKGDSGGPWITAGKDVNGNKTTCLIGLTESSPRNGVDRFTNVAEYVSNGWIKNTMKTMDADQHDQCNNTLKFDICKPDTAELKKKCRDLKMKKNMVLISGSLFNSRAGDTVTVGCSPLYVTVGSKQVSCTSRGNWKPDSLPQCISFVDYWLYFARHVNPAKLFQ
ncbi:unnamed protein product [Owenia fusiformis]|uniref:Uncharacterized protein n=1 Tax=Owenia fusiformis TaxID=6347 RepID=A0A8J1XP97_OWEFU|nr:unnamed protein product [Owenia fusiformis]